MEFKGSTGQWSLNCVGKSDLVIFSERRKGYRKVCAITKKFHEDSYNAQLIVCAPELLGALKYSLRMLKTNEAVFDREYIEEIIKKATEI